SLPLQITVLGQQQGEKFLFYRGVGDCTMPLTVRALGKGEFSIRNSGKDEVPGLILVRVTGGNVYFKVAGSLSARSEMKVTEDKEASTAEKLGEALTAMLIEQGLYEKEAKAMVKTWASDWFGQDGIRVW